MSRRDLSIKWLLYAAACLIFILLQGLIFNHICILQVHPFVFPLLVATAAVFEPPMESAVFGLIFGLLCDLTLPGMIPCYYTVAFLLAALLCALIAEKLIVPGFWCSLACGVLSVFLCDLINTLACHNQYGTRYADAFNLTGREILLALPLIPVIFFLFRYIHLRTKAD